MNISKKTKDEIRFVLTRMHELVKQKASGVSGYEGMCLDIEHSKNVQYLNISSEAKKYLRNKYYSEVAYAISTLNAEELNIRDEVFPCVAPVQDLTTQSVAVSDAQEIEADLVKKIMAQNRKLEAFKKYNSHKYKSKHSSKTLPKSTKAYASGVTMTAQSYVPITIDFEELSKMDTSRIYVPTNITHRSEACLIMAKINKLKNKRSSLVQSIIEFKQPSLFDMLDTDYSSYKKNTETYFERFNQIASQVSAIEKELLELHSWLDTPYKINSIETLIEESKTA